MSMKCIDLMILWFLTQENISLLLIIFCLALREFLKLHNALYTAVEYSVNTTTVQWTHWKKMCQLGDPALFEEILHIPMKDNLKIPGLLWCNYI